MRSVTPGEVEVEALPLERLAGLLEPDRAARLWAHAETARRMIGDRVVWNVNATASGGGVAEMLLAVIAYARGAGVDTRWLVLDGDAEFFATTKRVHNHLHGSTGDGGSLGGPERDHYEAVLARNLARLAQAFRPGDVVLLHDPQTAGLVSGVRDLGAHAVWRCHIGADVSTETTRAGWQFLRPYVEPAEALVFSRAGYAPDWVDQSRLFVIPPSIDPFTAKNCELTPQAVTAALQAVGLLEGDSDGQLLDFVHRDGSAGRVRRHTGVVVGAEPLPREARYVLQVSRWDRLKDMAGVLAGFASVVDSLPPDVHLVLAGPSPDGVWDDPEGAQVAGECELAWRALPPHARQRVRLCNLPMDDLDENAHLVNALQRRSSLVVQKSLAEGFGLTVTEPMWKGRAVLASRTGGIQDQIVDGESGVLLDDPRDLHGFGEAVRTLMQDDRRRALLGAAAHERVREHYLGDRHLIQYAELLGTLIG